jgi:hypothetical protein
VSALVDRDRVLEAVRGSMGLPTEPAGGVSTADAEAAAAAVVAELAAAHEHDLAQGEADLNERLAARFGPDFLHHAHVMVEIDHTMDQDRGAHSLAQMILERDLTDAMAAPAAEREPRVQALLDAERERLRSRGRTRVARVTRQLLAASGLADDAVHRVAAATTSAGVSEAAAAVPRFQRLRDGSVVRVLDG